jgi:hypothetical protein
VISKNSPTQKILHIQLVLKAAILHKTAQPQPTHSKQNDTQLQHGKPTPCTTSSYCVPTNSRRELTPKSSSAVSNGSSAESPNLVLRRKREQEHVLDYAGCICDRGVRLMEEHAV